MMIEENDEQEEQLSMRIDTRTQVDAHTHIGHPHRGHEARHHIGRHSMNRYREASTWTDKALNLYGIVLML